MLASLVLVALSAHPVLAEVAKGAQIAGQWCANCHVVGPNPTGAEIDDLIGYIRSLH